MSVGYSTSFNIPRVGPDFDIAAANVDVGQDILAGETVTSKGLELEPIGSNIADNYPTTTLWLDNSTGLLMLGDTPLTTSAAGEDQEVIYNDNGNLAGDSSLKFNPSTSLLSVFKIQCNYSNPNSYSLYTVGGARLGDHTFTTNTFGGVNDSAIRSTNGASGDIGTKSYHGIGWQISASDNTGNVYRWLKGSADTELMTLDESAKLTVNGELHLATNAFLRAQSGNLKLSDGYAHEHTLSELIPISSSVAAIPYLNPSTKLYNADDSFIYNDTEKRLHVPAIFVTGGSGQSFDLLISGNGYLSGNMTIGTNCLVSGKLSLEKNNINGDTTDGIRLLAYDDDPNSSTKNQVIMPSTLDSSSSVTPLQISTNGDGLIYVSSSSRRYKTTIRKASFAGKGVLDLKPVSYFYKSDIRKYGRKDSIRAFGFIAEDSYAVNKAFATFRNVEEVPADAVIHKNRKDGKFEIVDGINVQSILTATVDLCQRQEKRIARLERQLEEMEIVNSGLSEDIAALWRHIEPFVRAEKKNRKFD